jgi:uncharacterized repeat protein (TIGR01451 family)
MKTYLDYLDQRRRCLQKVSDMPLIKLFKYLSKNISSACFIRLLILLTAQLYSANPSWAAYTQNLVAQTPFQTVTNNWAAGDDTQVQVPIGFTFNFNGVNYTNVWINSNGVLSFSAGFNTWTNSALPNASPPNGVFGYWDDIDVTAGGNITYGTVGTAPNREFIVSWNAVALYGIAYTTASCSFQIVLGEDQSVRLRYSSASIGCAGASATTGIQETATSFIQKSLNTVIPLTQDVLYLRVSPVTVQKTLTVLCDPINGASNPKNLPGSISRWTISITNSGTLSANLTQLSDALSNLTTFDPNLVLGATATSCSTSAPPGIPENATGRGFKVTITGGTRTGYPRFMTNASDGDGATFTAPGTIAIDFATALPAMTGYSAGELKPSENVTIVFNVQLQ